MAYTFVSHTVSATTQRELGVGVSSHLFRDCSVYTIASNAGDQMRMASALLQHTDPRVTREHYNKSTTTAERCTRRQKSTKKFLMNWPAAQQNCVQSSSQLGAKFGMAGRLRQKA